MKFKLNRKPRLVTVLFWSCWILSVYFAIVELIVRNLGYPQDNTFVFLAIFSLIASGFFLAEMRQPGFFKKLVNGNEGDN